MNRKPRFLPDLLLTFVPDADGPVSRGCGQAAGAGGDGQAGQIRGQVKDHSQCRTGRGIPGFWPGQRKNDEHQDHDQKKRRWQREPESPDPRTGTVILVRGVFGGSNVRTWLALSMSKKEVAASSRSLHSTAQIESRKRSRLPEAASSTGISRDLRTTLEDPSSFFGDKQAVAGRESCMVNRNRRREGTRGSAEVHPSPSREKKAISRRHLEQGHGHAVSCR